MYSVLAGEELQEYIYACTVCNWVHTEHSYRHYSAHTHKTQIHTDIDVICVDTLLCGLTFIVLYS